MMKIIWSIPNNLLNCSLLTLNFSPMKNTAILMVVLMTSIFANAQSHTFEVGVLGGVNKMNPKKELSDIYQNTGAYGISFQYNLKPRFSIQSSAVFYSLRYNYTDNHTYVIYPGGQYKKSQVSGTFNYLTVPVMAKWTFGKKTKVFVNAGTQFIMSYNESATRIYDSGESVSGKYPKNRYDGSFIAGMGGSYPVSENLSVSVEGRIAGGYFSTLNSLYGSNMQLLFGLTYGFGSK